MDDEVPFVDTMTKRLSKRNLTVLAAHSGPEALDVLKEKQVDVVILDVKMPGMDGIQTLKEIKHRYPHLEVIMLTGHATVPSAVEAMQMGASDYMMKPVAMDLLIKKACEAIDRSRKTKQE